VRFVPIPRALARGASAAFRATANTLTGGKLSVISNASISFITEDNPFTSERARRELGWAPSVRPEDGVPEAFRWWLLNHR
jgi:nucleoside-diphosphate-sugar epimerase